jgi:hypothetical protein
LLLCASAQTPSGQHNLTFLLVFVLVISYCVTVCTTRCRE